MCPIQFTFDLVGGFCFVRIDFGLFDKFRYQIVVEFGSPYPRICWRADRNPTEAVVCVRV